MVAVGFALLFGAIGFAVDYFYSHHLNPTALTPANSLQSANRGCVSSARHTDPTQFDDPCFKAGGKVVALTAGFGTFPAFAFVGGPISALWFAAVAIAAIFLYCARPQ